MELGKRRAEYDGGVVRKQPGGPDVPVQFIVAKLLDANVADFRRPVDDLAPGNDPSPVAKQAYREPHDSTAWIYGTVASKAANLVEQDFFQGAHVDRLDQVPVESRFGHQPPI